MHRNTGKAYEKSKKTSLYAKDLLMEQMRKYYREEQEDTVSGSAEGSYVISFCTSGDSLLMWSEYSDFMGYCMEFEYGKIEGNIFGTLRE